MALLKVVGDIVASNTITGNNIAANTISAAQIRNDVNIGGPKISSISYVDDNTAADTAGGETITITGSGFNAGATVLIESVAVSLTTVVNSNTITFTAPAKAAGSYIIYVVNTDGSTAILVPGIQYSGTPTWTTSAGSLGTFYETVSFANTVAATGDGTITYSLLSGALPTGATINSSNGTISGTAPLEGGSSTYTFTLNAIDSQNQETSRQFSITINTDPVTWSAPANNATITTYEYTAIPSNTFVATSATGKSISYSANVLPANVSIAGDVVSGVPNTVGNTTSLITATAATTGRTSTRTLNFVVQPDIVSWSAPANNATITTYEYVAIPSNTFVSTSAAGFNVSYSANVLPANISISGAVLSGTPNTVGNTTSLITSTAATTGRTATQTLNFVVAQDVVTWGSPANNTTYTLPLNAANTISLSATSAAGFNVSYAANSLPTGLAVSGSTITGTPTLAGNSSSLITATAATTGRTAALTLNWVIQISGDSYWKNVALLISANTSTQTNSHLQDASSFGKIMTSSETAMRATEWSPYTAGYGSVYMDQTSSISSESRPYVGTGDFTIEGWMYAIPTANTASLFGLGGSSLAFNAAYTNLTLTVGGVAVLSSYSYTTPTNRWVHVAIVRSGSTVTLYYDGAVVSSGTTAAEVTITAVVYGSSFNGYISNVRVTKQALYTAAFTRPSAPFSLSTVTANTLFIGATGDTRDLLSQSNNSYSGGNSWLYRNTSNHPFLTIPSSYTYNGSYSIRLDGASAGYGVITIADSANSELGSSDFTFETWYNAFTDGGYIIGKRNAASADYGTFQIGVSKTSISVLGVLQGGSPWNLNFSATGFTNQLYTWHHLALVRSGDVYTIYVDGVARGNTTLSGALNNSVYDWVIGAYQSNGVGAWSGLISNMRLVRGAALYTSTFTPSTVPLTPIANNTANTAFLIGHTNRLIDGSNNNFTLTTTGAPIFNAGPFNTVTNTANVYINTIGATYFSGGSGLTIENSNTMNTGTADVTYEAWVCFEGSTSSGTIYGGQSVFGYGQGDQAGGVAIASTGGSSSPYITFWGPSNTYGSQGAVFEYNGRSHVWYHFAVVRTGGNTFKVYQNGKLKGTYTDSSSISYNTYPFRIGYGLRGWICDVRVTRGALYTTNFAPPREPLTATANTLLLTCQYRGNMHNNRFMDTSGHDITLTGSGNPTQGIFSPYGDNWSNYFDGTGDYLSTTVPAIGTGNFTFETWVNRAVSSGMNDSIFSINSSNEFYVQFYTNVLRVWMVGLSTSFIDYTGVSSNQWYHIAVTRSGTTVRLFIDGTLRATGTSSGDITTTTAYIGSTSTTSNMINAHISNLRLIVGEALYTSAFTPPSAPLTATANTRLLTCQSNRLIDNSTRNATITRGGDVRVQKFSPFSTVTVPKYYSAYFDGTSDYLTVPSSANSAFNPTNGFTVEGWVYFRSNPSYQFIVSSVQGVGAFESYWFVGTTPGGNWRVSYGDASAVDTGTPITLNRWTHFAISCSSSNAKFFVDGVQISSVSKTQQNISMNLMLGTYAYGPEIGSYGLNGSLSNIRYINGQQLYTSNFTPSTTPLTAVSGTSLLTCQDNTFKDNSTNNFTITATGDVRPQLISPFTPTPSSVTSYSANTFGGSMYFDGTGDWITGSTSADNQLTGNFTIECWAYPTTIGSQMGLVTLTNTTSSGSNGLAIYFDTNNKLSFWVNGNGGTATTTTAYTANQWYHIALVRSGSTNTLYVNGIASVTNSTSPTWPTTPTVAIGRLYNDNSSYLMTGYIADVRIIKGTALYTSNFYPGPTPLTSTATIGANTYNSSLLISGTSGGINDASRTVDVETVGDVRLVNESPYEAGYYSNYFDGTGDYLTTPASLNTTFGSGDFTVEFWTRPTVAAGTWTTLLSIGVSTAAGKELRISQGHYTYGTLGVLYPNSSNNGDVYAQDTGYTLPLNAWTHVAVCRSGSSMYLFADGVLKYTYTVSFDMSTNCYVNIGNNPYNDLKLTGHMSNVRIIKGTALYTSAFTPPTAALTAVSGTQLLTCQSNRLIDMSTNGFTITKNGDVAVKSINPFRGALNKSMYFDGAGDHLNVVDTLVTNNLGVGDYTAECWFYTTDSTQIQTLLWFNGNTSAYAALRLGISSGAINFYVADGGGSWGVNSGGIGSVVNNQWYHIAVTRSSNDYKVFLNGAQIGTTYTQATVYSTGTLSYIGALNNASGGNTVFRQMYGYIADVRITRGTVRYTTAFTPPTAPLEIK